MKWDFFLQARIVNYWILKSEPGTYSYERLESEGIAVWDGIRNYAARNNLREMKKGDMCYFYHSNLGKHIVGIAKVTKEHYQDPTSTDTAWLAVDIAPYKKLKRPVTLDEMKKVPSLLQIDLIRIGRLSVSKISETEFKTIEALSLT